MKDEEFRKLLVEYAKEISDPENKKVGFIALRILVVVECPLFILLVDCNFKLKKISKSTFVSNKKLSKRTIKVGKFITGRLSNMMEQQEANWNTLDFVLIRPYLGVFIAHAVFK